MRRLALTVRVDLRQRIGIDLDDVVEKAHREANDALHLVPVDRPAPVPLAREPGDVERAQVARLVRQQGLFATLVKHDAVGDEGMALRLGEIVDRPDPGGLDRDDRVGEALRVEAAVANRAQALLFGSKETNGLAKGLTGPAEDAELVQHAVGAIRANTLRQMGE